MHLFKMQASVIWYSVYCIYYTIRGSLCCSWRFRFYWCISWPVKYLFIRQINEVSFFLSEKWFPCKSIWILLWVSKKLNKYTWGFHWLLSAILFCLKKKNEKGCRKPSATLFFVDSVRRWMETGCVCIRKEDVKLLCLGLQPPSLRCGWISSFCQKLFLWVCQPAAQACGPTQRDLAQNHNTTTSLSLTKTDTRKADIFSDVTNGPGTLCILLRHRTTTTSPPLERKQTQNIFFSSWEYYCEQEKELSYQK